MNILKRAARKARFLASYLRAHAIGWMRKSRYRELEAFLIFVGYPRSGHTLIASLLDAHPDIMISIEWGVLPHLRMGFRKHAILYSVEKFSRLFTEKLSNRWTGYSYRVEGQWQGRARKIKIMGDKLAGQTSTVLRDNPGLLEELHREMGIRIKILHIIRNPFDTITTMAHRSLEKDPDDIAEPDLSGFSERYFERAEIVNSLKTSPAYSFYDLYHEDFIQDPIRELSGLLDFLDIDYDGVYLEDCSRIVYPSPHLSRRQYHWPDSLIREVQSRIREYPFLNRYTYSE